MDIKNSRATLMSDEFRWVLQIMSFLGRLGQELSSPDGCIQQRQETYNFSAILEITVSVLEEKATRLIASRHSGSIFSGPRVSK